MNRLICAGAVLVLAVSGCSSAGKPDKTADPQAGRLPPTSTFAPSTAPAVPGAKKVEGSPSLKKPVSYPDGIEVRITKIRKIVNSEDGPGNVKGQVITVFTLRFTNRSGQPLDLDGTRIVAAYGAGKKKASPSYPAEVNDFFGEVAPQGVREASYAFVIPVAKYGKVSLNATFGTGHKAARWSGSLKL
ncbi:hypothetical protein GCM10027589_38010 [Actinocorallia lasiicapitis]